MLYIFRNNTIFYNKVNPLDSNYSNLYQSPICSFNKLYTFFFTHFFI